MRDNTTAIVDGETLSCGLILIGTDYSTTDFLVQKTNFLSSPRVLSEMQK